MVRLPGPPAVALAAQGALLMVGLLVRRTHRLSRYLLIGARVGVGFGLALLRGAPLTPVPGYASQVAFRRALTDRLRVLAAEGRWTLPQLQRQIA